MSSSLQCIECDPEARMDFSLCQNKHVLSLYSYTLELFLLKYYVLVHEKKRVQVRAISLEKQWSGVPIEGRSTFLAHTNEKPFFTNRTSPIYDEFQTL